MEACVRIPANFSRADTYVKYKTVKAGDFLVYEFYDTVDRLSLIFKMIVVDWLPASKHKLDNREVLHFMQNDLNKDPNGKAKISLHIPIIKT